MSNEFRYNLSIIGPDKEGILDAAGQLAASGVSPNILTKDCNPFDMGGPFCMEFSTENHQPYGTAPFWHPNDHEKFFHELSVNNPSLLFKLSGESIDDPNNGIFLKAFQNGQFKEVYQEKLDIHELLDEVAWKPFGAPVREGKEGDVFRLFESISSMRNDPNYQIAADMAYLRDYSDLDEPLTEDELFTLASKLDEVSGSFFYEPLLHEEYLSAICDMLVYGLKENFPNLNRADTRELLMCADNQVFATLVEVTAMNSHERFMLEVSHAEDIDAVKGFIQTYSNPSLSKKIAAAQETVKGSVLKQSGREVEPTR